MDKFSQSTRVEKDFKITSPRDIVFGQELDSVLENGGAGSRDVGRRFVWNLCSRNRGAEGVCDERFRS